MARILTIFTISLILTSCCSFDKSDIEFSHAELGHFSDYKNGDTIYFESNFGDIDTLEIIGFENEKHDSCFGLMAPKPSNSRWISIKHLPNDDWKGTTKDRSKPGQIKIDYQGLLWISKDPIEKTTEYRINFKDFHSVPDSVIGQYYSEPLTLNNIDLTNYYKVEYGYPERVSDSIDIKVVYWTDEEGLIAYQNKGGEVWTKKELRTHSKAY